MSIYGSESPLLLSLSYNLGVEGDVVLSNLPEYEDYMTDYKIEYLIFTNFINMHLEEFSNIIDSKYIINLKLQIKKHLTLYEARCEYNYIAGYLNSITVLICNMSNIFKSSYSHNKRLELIFKLHGIEKPEFIHKYIYIILHELGHMYYNIMITYNQRDRINLNICSDLLKNNYSNKGKTKKYDNTIMFSCGGGHNIDPSEAWAEMYAAHYFNHYLKLLNI